MPIAVMLTGKLDVAPRKAFPIQPPPVVPGLPTEEIIEIGFGHMNAFPIQLHVLDGCLLK